MNERKERERLECGGEKMREGNTYDAMEEGVVWRREKVLSFPIVIIIVLLIIS